MKKIFLVVLNWNGANDTIECLNSIDQLRTKDIKLHVVVVDNGSVDNSKELLGDIKLKKASYKLIENKENLGYAGGMNVGIKYALDKGADYVTIINNDVELDKNILNELVRTAKKYPKAGIICPKIYFAKGYEFHKNKYSKNELGKVIWYAGGEIDWDNAIGVNKGVDQVDEGQFDDDHETDFATGNCMLIRSKAIKGKKLFDENYFMYLEDVDFCVRMTKSGWNVVYSPKGLLWHKVARSSAIGGDLNDYFIMRNRMIFGMRYAPLRTKIALVRQSFYLLRKGRTWQKTGIKDYYKRNFGKGSWK
jgi:GT2 family glycosyltransferase